MDLLKMILRAIVAVASIVTVFVLLGIKSELAEINAFAVSKKHIYNSKGMKAPDYKLKKMEKGINCDLTAKKEKMGKDWGNWTASKELCVQKLDKIQELLQTKEFETAEKKNELAAKFKQLKSAVEEEDADYTDLFKEIKILIKELK
jgi:mRNA-degrading endonuclease YafQ of YafQ-DinJ toxin-antitoxin module